MSFTMPVHVAHLDRIYMYVQEHRSTLLMAFVYLLSDFVAYQISDKCISLGIMIEFDNWLPCLFQGRTRLASVWLIEFVG